MCVRLFLQRAQLEYSEEEPHILGQGGSGTIIYQAQYQNQPVAIKRFHFKKCQQQTNDSNTGTETLFSCKFKGFLSSQQSIDTCAFALNEILIN